MLSPNKNIVKIIIIHFLQKGSRPRRTILPGCTPHIICYQQFLAFAVAG
jgi:hypothetical protein